MTYLALANNEAKDFVPLAHQVLERKLMQQHGVYILAVKTRPPFAAAAAAAAVQRIADGNTRRDFFQIFQKLTTPTKVWFKVYN